MDGRRFLFVSMDAALIGDLARQIHREGHAVTTIDHHVFEDFDVGIRHV